MSENRKRSAIVLALACAMALTGVQLVQAAVVVKAVSSSTNVSGFAFKPARLEANPGTKVVWKSVVGTHTVTAISRNWNKDASFSPGDPTAFTFNQAGTYRYRCSFHSTYNGTTKKCSGMCGRVIVG